MKTNLFISHFYLNTYFTGATSTPELIAHNEITLDVFGDMVKKFNTELEGGTILDLSEDGSITVQKGNLLYEYYTVDTPKRHRTVYRVGVIQPDGSTHVLQKFFSQYFK